MDMLTKIASTLRVTLNITSNFEPKLTAQTGNGKSNSNAVRALPLDAQYGQLSLMVPSLVTP